MTIHMKNLLTIENHITIRLFAWMYNILVNKKNALYVQWTAEMDGESGLHKLVEWWMLSFPSTTLLLYFFRFLTVHKRHINGDKILCAQLYLFIFDMITRLLWLFQYFLWSRCHDGTHMCDNMSFPNCLGFEPLKHGNDLHLCPWMTGQYL